MLVLMNRISITGIICSFARGLIRFCRENLALGTKKIQPERIWRNVTDSRTIPLKWGVLGTALGYCGFVGLRNEIGHPDLYGRKMKMTQINNAEALAVAAVYVGGESAESQPPVVVSWFTTDCVLPSRLQTQKKKRPWKFGQLMTSTGQSSRVRRGKKGGSGSK